MGKDPLYWLHTDWVLSQFGKRTNTCRKRYMEFVQAGQGEGYREELHGPKEDQRLLGDDQFIENILGKVPVQAQKKIQLNDIIQQVCKVYKIKKEEVESVSRNRRASEVRQVIAWLAIKTNGITLTQVAQHVGRDVTTLSRGVKRLEDRMQA